LKASINVWRRLFLYDWQRRLIALLVCVFLWQFIDWIVKEEEVWLEQTISVVRWTLIVTLLIELLPRLIWFIRSLLQLIAIIVVNVNVLSGVGMVPELEWASFFSKKMLDSLLMLSPFLWFSLGAWVVYLTMVWWVEAKWRIYTMIIVSVTAISIRDSFSTIYLWQQVAIILFCGLFLLIMCNFQQLKRKDPSAYGYLSEYPASIATPVILLVSLTVMIGALMPEINPMLTDPYTAWRNFKGQPAAFTTGKGMEIAASSYDTSSGYSRSDQALGGGFAYDFTPVMTIDTTHRSYWRGETRSLYTGKGWEPSEAERRAQLSAVRADTPLPNDPRVGSNSQLQTVEVKQTVTMQNDQSYPVLFGSINIQKIEEADGVKSGMEKLLWAPLHGELRFNEQVKQPYPKVYSIVSQMPVIEEDGLRTAPMDLPNRSQMADYLQLPDNLPPRIRQLAADLTKDAMNPYDKVKKIEDYLKLTYPYTNKPDLSKGRGRDRDFVDRFLFDIREGYCDYYSTSMAVLLRAVGIPTRWVKGYASGLLPYDDSGILSTETEMVDPDIGGVYTVRNADAHSWVEVYFSGWGWIPFEPTSGFAMPRAVPALDLTADLAAVPDLTESELSVLPSAQHLTVSGAVVAFIVILLYLSVRFDVPALLQERLKQRKAHLFKQKIIVECERMLRIFKRKGYAWHEHETIREAMRRWITQSKWMQADLELILALFEKAKYSRSEVTEEDWNNALRTVQKLRSQL
jgi:transglutaminase-like putative cysteine protease